ncbi:MAG: elongation factor P [Armatimonadota bacterium]|nr:elongation factor P [Armatimonadota bacterium]MDR7443560.1 elongation factor P [Armatimonadota bacterium]MDR7570944.1 elongation factor P [Armatimonadota bacterium]
MVAASELRSGMVIRLEGELFRVITASYHAGGGQMGGVTHAKLRNTRTGTVREVRFRADELIEDVQTTRRNMQVLYQDGEATHFMDTETFEQVDIQNARLGPAAAYLREGMTVPVEFSDGEPVGVVFPDVVEVQVVETAPPSRAIGTENVWKEAKLENGLVILVPPFIAPGEWIRVDVETASYVERAKRKARGER